MACSSAEVEITEHLFERLEPQTELRAKVRCRDCGRTRHQLVNADWLAVGFKIGDFWEWHAAANARAEEGAVVGGAPREAAT